MPEFIDSLLQRQVFIALAIAGAGIATVGSYLLRKKTLVGTRTARFILRVGYGLSWASVAIFIIIGFTSAT